MTTEPIEIAYEAFARRVAAILCAAGFIERDEDLKVDPETRFTPSGAETAFVAWAALFNVRTQDSGARLGGERPVWIVDRQVQLELAMAGPAQEQRHDARRQALIGLATLADAEPTLGGACERLFLDVRDDDSQGAAGPEVILDFTLRVRSGDRLGLTPV